MVVGSGHIVNVGTSHGYNRLDSSFGSLTENTFRFKGYDVVILAFIYTDGGALGMITRLGGSGTEGLFDRDFKFRFEAESGTTTLNVHG